MNDTLKTQIVKDYSDIQGQIHILDENHVNFHGSQKPFEFFNAWDELEQAIPDTDTVSFLEIGAYRGLWAVAFYDWCKAHSRTPNYTTVTLISHDQHNDYLLRTEQWYQARNVPFKLFDANSQFEETRNAVRDHKSHYDFVLIDADHAYEGVKKDIQLYASMATSALFFHDIRPKEGSCGVYKAIQEAGIILNKEIVASEDMMGIGIHYVK